MKHSRLILAALVLAAAGGAAWFFLGQNAKNPASAQTASAAPGEIWTKRCMNGEADKCEIFQSLAIQESGQRLIEFAVGYAGTGENPKAVMILPLGIDVSAGVAFRVDEQPQQKAAIKTCSQNGCFAVTELSAPVLESMKAGRELLVGVANNEGKTIAIKLSLQGFGEKLASIRPPV